MSMPGAGGGKSAPRTMAVALAVLILSAAGLVVLGIVALYRLFKG
jgi:hypothetical protein